MSSLTLTVRPSLFFPPREYRLPSLGSGRKAGLWRKDRRDEHQAVLIAIRSDQIYQKLDEIIILHNPALRKSNASSATTQFLFSFSPCSTHTCSNSVKVLTLPHGLGLEEQDLHRERNRCFSVTREWCYHAGIQIYQQLHKTKRPRTKAERLCTVRRLIDSALKAVQHWQWSSHSQLTLINVQATESK